MAVIPHTLSRSGKRMGVNETAGSLPDIHPLVSNWNRMVINSGGAAPSTKTINALSRFVYSLAFYNLLSKMIAVNCFVPDNLTACTIPLITNAGNNIWTNVNFVGGDLTVNGLAGDASTKRLESGIIPASVFSLTNCGGTAYITTAQTTQGWEFGTFSSTQVSFWLGLTCKYSDGSTSLNIYDSSGVNPGASPGSGFYSANRTGLNDARLFFGHSSSSLAQIGSTSTTTAQQIPVVNSMPIFCVRSQGGSAFQFTNHRISFIGFHDGMTFSQNQDFFKCVQQMRVDLGGGFI